MPDADPASTSATSAELLDGVRVAHETGGLRGRAHAGMLTTLKRRAGRPSRFRRHRSIGTWQGPAYTITSTHTAMTGGSSGSADPDATDLARRSEADDQQARAFGAYR